MRSKLAVAALVAVACQSSAIYPDVSAPDFEFVGIVGGGASGTAISPFNVITAKHVGGMSFQLQGFGTFTATSRVDHPNADLAILRFDSPLPGFYAPMFADEIGQQVVMVGFGDTGDLRDNGTGYNSRSGFGVRRKANQMVSHRQPVDLGGGIENSVSLWYDLDGNGKDMFHDGGPIAGEGGINYGDSGGGWFREIGGAKFIVAVNSFIFDGNGGGYYDFGDGGGAVDLNNYKEWVTENLVPEPASMAVLALGVAAVVRRRRGRWSRQG